MKQKIFLFIFIIICGLRSAAYTDSIFIYSKVMKKDIRAYIIQPDQYKKKSYRVPVIYMLHGASGNAATMSKRVPELEKMATQYGIMIVCPDGSPNSWYIDSPADSAFRFETYISKEVPDYIDKHYLTLADRKHRAIAGMSMGGYGAMFIAFRHPEIFGACGSMSGAFDPGTFKTSYDVPKRFGDSAANGHYYREWNIAHVIEHAPKDTLAVMIDCGLSDPFLPLNREVHEKLLKLNIPHDYTERPGKHDWVYWRNALRYEILFFSQYFKGNG